MADIKDVAEYVALAKQKADLDAELKSVKAKMKKLELGLIDFFTENGMQSSNVDGRTCYLHRQVWASLKDKDAGAEVFKRCGLGDMVKESINGQTLSAWVREQLDDVDVPADSAVDLASLLDQPQEIKDVLKVSEVVSLRVVK